MPGTQFADVATGNRYCEAKMLDTAMPDEIFGRFGAVKPMPKNKGEKISHRRARLLPNDIPVLTEGVTPNTTAFGYDRVEFTLQQFGRLLEVTDKLEMLAEDPVLNDMLHVSGIDITTVRENVAYGVLKAGSTVFFNNGAARGAVNTPITISKIEAVVAFLKRTKARPVTKIVDGSVKFGTKPIPRSYLAFCHTDMESDIRKLPNFVPVEAYGQNAPVHINEFGSVPGVRFITSPQMEPWLDAGGAKGAMRSTSGANADVYPVIFIGEDAYCQVPLRGAGAIEPSVIPTGTKDKSDPLGQRGYVGWKGWMQFGRLNELWMARLEVAATAL